VQQRPQLSQTVLQRRACQQEAGACGEGSESASESRLVVLQAVAFIHNHDLPLQQSDYYSYYTGQIPIGAV
jgi:hypothetical protein